jgi:hypothetical protein
MLFGKRTKKTEYKLEVYNGGILKEEKIFQNPKEAYIWAKAINEKGQNYKIFKLNEVEISLQELEKIHKAGA